MNVNTQILKQLPSTFNRQYIIKMFVEKGYSLSYADSKLEDLTHSGGLKRIGRGKYKNLTKR